MRFSKWTSLAATVAVLVTAAAGNTLAQQSEGAFTPDSIVYPFYLRHGLDSTVLLEVSNAGDATLTGTLTKSEDTGPPDWLGLDQISVNIAPGATDTIGVILNQGGIVNAPGAIVQLRGDVILSADQPTATDSLFLHIDILVVDTVILPEYATASSGCIALTVANTGNLGHQGTGGANLDFTASGLECDNSASIPGEADVYLYDASPIIFLDNGVGGSWSMYTDNLAESHVWRPVADPDEPVMPQSWTGENYEAVASGAFVTADSSVQLNQVIYLPNDPDTCNLAIQRVRVFSADGSQLSGLTIGAAWDWNVPSDSGARNIAGANFINGVVWLQGAEYDQDPSECQENSRRFGGVGFIGYTDFQNPTPNTADPANIYSADNGQFVIPGQGFDSSALYAQMQGTAGITTLPATTAVDQHLVMTVFKDYSLAAGDTLELWFALASVRDGTETDIQISIDKARDWYAHNSDVPAYWFSPGCCVGMTGNVNDDPLEVVDISDVMAMINCLFVDFEWCNRICYAEANTNGDPGCAVDISDVTRLINYLFVTFNDLAPCNPDCEQ